MFPPFGDRLRRRPARCSAKLLKKVSLGLRFPSLSNVYSMSPLQIYPPLSVLGRCRGQVQYWIPRRIYDLTRPLLVLLRVCFDCNYIILCMLTSTACVTRVSQPVTEPFVDELRH